MDVGDPPSAADFEALEQARTRALVQRDLARVEQLHAPDYELITPSGAVWTRAAYLAHLARAPFYTDWRIDGLRVRGSAAAAVLRYQATLAFPSGRQVVVWHTDWYERRDAGWQAVWSQATECRAAGAAR